MFQRFLHLINDSNHAQMCNKDGATVSVGGAADRPVRGVRRVPDRQPRDVLRALDRDGDRFDVQHAGTLPVLELDNFYDQVRPIVQAFVDAGAEQLFVDVMAVLHKHWSSAASSSTQTTDPAGANYAFGSGGET